MMKRGRGPMRSAWLKSRMLVLSLSIMAALCGSAVTSSAQAPQPPKDMMKLSLSPGLVSIIRVPNWVAASEGLYKKNGLDMYQCVGKGDVDSLKKIANVDVPMDVRCAKNVES